MADSAEGSWHGFGGPSDYVPKRVAAAFDELINASSAEAARQAYNAMFEAICTHTNRIVRVNGVRQRGPRGRW